MIGLTIVLIMLASMIVLRLLKNNLDSYKLRVIPALRVLKDSVDHSVETGLRFHITLGHGGVVGLPAASSLSGLALLSNILKKLVDSENPPVISAGESILGLLGQNAALSSSRELGGVGLQEVPETPITGLTPYSYAVGTLPIILDEDEAVNVMLGSFGSEIGLMAEAAEKSGSLAAAGTENLTAQSVLTAIIPEVLIGEELFASGAYLQSGKMHIASLQAQDMLRLIIVVFIILAVVLKLLGIL